MEIKKVAEEWEIWDEEEKIARSEVEAKKMVSEKFHQWIKVFGKKQLERMPTRKVWDHVIKVKEGFVPKKGKVYSVVVTTRRNSTCDMLTSAKLLVGYLVVGITRELNKEPLLHCYSIYISYRWSMLQQCVYLMSTPQ